MQIYISFFLYMALILGIGIYSYRKTTGFDDYILGGRKMGSFVTAMSAGASDMSGWLLLGLPGAIYASGLSEAWIAIGLTIGAWANYRISAGRLRSFTEQYANSLTLPEYFAARFPKQGQLLKITSSFVILFFFTVYCASGVVAGAKLFETFLGIPYNQALWLGAIATLSYTFIGGYLAVSYSDTIQASLMIFVLLLAPVIIILTFNWSEITAALDFKTTQTGIPYNNLVFNVSGIGVISAMAWGLGYFGQPHILARFMASGSIQAVQQARKIGITWMIFCLGGAVAVGYFGLAYFTITGENPGDEAVFMALAKAIFNPWVVGIVLSAILAAIMSTLSAQLLICSATITEDFYHGYIRKQASSRELVWVGRAMVLIITLVAIALAYDPNSRVMGLVSYAWAGFGASFGPVVILSLYNRNVTATSCLLGMLIGAVTVIAWEPFMNYVGWYDLGKLYSLLPGFLMCSAFCITSAIFSRVDQATAKIFDQAEDQYLAAIGAPAKER